MLAVLILGAAALVVLELWPSAVALRSVLGLPFLLLGVGYVAINEIYGRERPDGAATILLTLALSLAIIVLTALGMYATSIAFTGRAFLLAELVVTAALAAVAVARRHSRGRRARAQLRLARRRPKLAWRSDGMKLAASCLVPMAVLAGLIVALSRPLPNAHVAGYGARWAVRGAGNTVQGE